MTTSASWATALGQPPTSPIQVPGLDEIVAIAAGRGNSMALRDDGVVFTWGHDQFGQIGDGPAADQCSGGLCRPSPVQLSLSNVVAISAGAQHLIALTGDGRVWAWGQNSDGQLGN